MTDKNTLEEGEGRFGHVYDGNPDTPTILGQLERKNDDVVLSVFWDDMSAPVSRWFMSGAMFGDDPDRTRYRYEAPRTLEFRDERGSVRLVGCRSMGMNGQLLGAGRGRIAVRYCVLGRVPSDSAFESIYGLRTSLSGLRSWLGVRSVRRPVPETDAAGRVQSLKFTLDSPPALEVVGVEALRLVPTWSTSQPDPDSVELRERLHMETWYDEARPWREHLSVHRGLRDLLAVSRWRREEFTEAFARADDDRASEDRLWAPTISKSIVGDELPMNSREHLIQFTDIGLQGIASWFSLREEYQRAIDPLVSSIYMSDATVESKVSQAGIGLEALGFLLTFKVDGLTENQASRKTYVERFTRIAEPMSDVLPLAVDAWARGFADAYNSVKHANRNLKSTVDLANGWREAVLVFRCWVALALGIDRQTVRRRLADDPLAHAFVLAD